VLRLIICAIAVALASVPSLAQTKAPAGAEVYFISPADGETLTSPIAVRFGLKGMGVAPAGVEKPNTGHHHLLIDQKLADLKNPIPADDKHVHFGNGQTEVSIVLAPGRHTLQLFLGDHNHIPHDPPVASKVVTVTVK
jgi:hypothetical protein